MKHFILATLLCVLAVQAQANELPLRSITVSGEAKQMVQPDQALVSLTLESSDLDLANVKKAQDAKLQKVMTIAKDLKIDAAQIKTDYTHTYPEYVYHNERQVFKAYVSRTTLTLTLNDLSKVGGALEAFIAAGFDRMNNVQYQIKDDQPIREAIKLKAIANAQQKAESMAKALGMKLGKPLHINEAQVTMPDYPVYGHKMAMARGMAESADSAAVAPPAGENELRESVTVIFEMME